MFHVKQPISPSDHVSRETRQRLQAYADLLTTWNRTINLVAKADIQTLWTRHIDDALQLIPMLPPGIPHAIDIGSGGGIPGLILAIATGIPFHLIEADHRKSAFLREAARLCAAPVTVHTCRIEAANLPAAECVTARALAPLNVLLALAHPLLTSTGTLIAPKGRGVEAELTQAAEQWHMRVSRTPSVTDPAATILQISEVSRVGSHS